MAAADQRVADLDDSLGFGAESCWGSWATPQQELARKAIRSAAGCLAAPGHTLRASVLHYPQARGALPLLLRLQSASRPAVDGANRLAQPHQPVKSSNARA